MYEQASGFDLFSVQTHDEVEVYTGSDQFTFDDGGVALDIVEPLPCRPGCAHRGTYEHQRFLGSEQPACSCSFDWIIKIPRQSVGGISAREIYGESRGKEMVGHR